MRVWLDALTSKQALIMNHLERKLMKEGHEAIITCRNYDYVVSLLKLKGSRPVVYGGYGETLEDKIRAGLERERFFVDLWEVRGRPDVHVSLTSPEAIRVAFRLKVPVIALSDSPHSIYVNKLTMPLADVVITPKCTPKEAYAYAVRPERIVQFDGLFEVMWIKGASYSPYDVRDLGLEPFSYIVLRPEEKKASYYPGGYEQPTKIGKLVKAVIEETELKVVVFPRYRDQGEYLRRLSGRRVLIPPRAVNTIPLLKYAVMVITGGGTMATEAALLGTPAITFFPRKLDVMRYLEGKGFPLIHIAGLEDVLKEALRIMRDHEAYRMDTESMLKEVEEPTDLIIEHIEELGGIRS